MIFFVFIYSHRSSILLIYFTSKNFIYFYFFQNQFSRVSFYFYSLFPVPISKIFFSFSKAFLKKTKQKKLINNTQEDVFLTYL